MTTVYSKSNCPQCIATKRTLKKIGVAYHEVDLETDNEARAMVKGMGFQSAPVVITGEGESWSGFRPDLLKTLAR